MLIKKTKAQYQRTVRKIDHNIDAFQSRIMSYAIENDLDCRYILSSINHFNVIRHDRKFYAVKVVDKVCDSKGSVAYSTRLPLYASRPQYFYQQFDLVEVKEQNYSVMTLNNVMISGGSNFVLLSPSEALYEPYFYDEKNAWDYTDPVIRQNFKDVFVIQCKRVNGSIHEGIMLSGAASYNFYHYIYEFLSKVLFLNELDLPSTVPLIVDEVVCKYPQFQQLLDCFNKSKREVICLKSGQSYDVGKLYYLPFINIIPPNYKNILDIKYSDNLFSLESIKFLRNSLLPRMTKLDCGRKIFIARRNTTALRSYNEEEIEAIFIKHGFDVICPEKLGVSEQMYVFNNADFIAGATGAAFSNILFCSPGCKVLCINSYNVELSIFSTIAKYLKLDFQYLSAYDENYKTQNLHETFKISPEKVESSLIDFLGR